MLKAKVKAEAEHGQEKMPSINSVNEDELHQESANTTHLHCLAGIQGRVCTLGLGHHRHPDMLHFNSHHQHGSVPHLTPWSWQRSWAGVLGFPTLEQNQPALRGRNYFPNLIPSTKYDKCGLAALAPDELEK